MLSILKNLKEETLEEDKKDKDETTHSYTAIAIDTENNEFKIVNGNFSDKKEFYERLSNRGLVVRKVLERPIYEWIMKNADTNLDAYAMLSTAFSKWRGNNLLSDDYVQLLNDVPSLNRERRKGDPNTKGKAKKGWGESVLKEYYKPIEWDSEGAIPHKLSIYPLSHSGEVDPSYANKPIVTNIKTFDTTNPKKRFDDPDFYRLMFKLMKIDAIGGRDENGKAIPHAGFRIIVDDDYKNPVEIPANDLLNHYYTKNKNPNYYWGPNNATQTQYEEIEKKLRDSLKTAQELGDEKEVASLETQLKNIADRKADAQRRETDWKNALTKEEKEEYDNLGKELYANIVGLTPKQADPIVKEYSAKMKDIEKRGRQRIEDKFAKKDSRFASIVRDIQDRMDAGANAIKHGNPSFGGDPFGVFGSRMDRYAKQQSKLNKAEQIKNGFALKYMTPQEKERYNKLKDAIANRDPEKHEKLIDARKIIDDKQNRLINKAADQDKVLSNIFNNKKFIAQKTLENILNNVEIREGQGIADKLANYTITPFDSENAKKELVVDFLDTSEKNVYNKIKGTPQENDFLEQMVKKYRKDLAKPLEDLRKANKQKSKPEYREELLVDLMAPKEKKFYKETKNALNALSKGFPTNVDILKNPEDIKVDSSIVNLLNDKEKKIYEDFSNELNKDKAEYADLNEKIKKFDKYFENDKRLKQAKDNLLATVREREADKIEKDFRHLEEIQAAKKPVKTKSNIKGWTNPEAADLLSGYNQNKLKNIGYDSSLDLSPYRKKQTESFVNDGATGLNNSLPKPTRSGTPLSIGGKFVETTTHSELNTELFENDKLKQDVREAMLKIADTFKDTLDLPMEPVDIYFTGSCANYNYNEKSDIDLHLVYDFEQAGINAEILSKYLQSEKKIFNDKYDITIKNIPVELGAENLNEPLVSTGIYSVMNDDWIRKPENADTEISDPDMPYYTKLTGEIENAIQSKDTSIIGKLWKKLGKLRKESLAKEGEFGPGNALFKKLRNLNYLTRLKDAYYDNMSKELSLESLEEIN